MKNCPECQKNEPAPLHRDAAVVLVGNMNVGTSTLFRQMCGDETFRFKFPGTTVSLKAGFIKGTTRQVFLAPGIYSVFSMNEDEAISRDILLPVDNVTDIKKIILVADAKNLKRGLAITLPYMEYGLPILLNVNMTDEAASRGIEIDYQQLSALLGMDVNTSVAREGIGVKEIVAKLDLLQVPAPLASYPEWIENVMTQVGGLLPDSAVSPRALSLLLLVEDQRVERYLRHHYGKKTLALLKKIAAQHRQGDAEAVRVFLGNYYNTRAEQIVRQVQQVEQPDRYPLLAKVGDWCTQLHTGLPIAVAVIAAMYLFIGSFGATYLVDTINGTLFEGLLIPWFTKLLAPLPFPFIRDLIMDPDFGILPTGVFLALGLVLPVLFCFYFAFGVLQDSGYLPRLSILLDKLFQKMGLNGKGVIPLVMGFSCVTMAILTTRMLGSRKERNIATFLLLLGMPCAPLIAVMLIILEKMPFYATITIFGFLLVQTFVAGIALNRILPGERSPFLMEIPPLRLPKFLQVLRMSVRKTLFFMKEAVPIFIFASCVVFLFNRMGGLAMLEKMARPLVTEFMGLPEKSIQVFIKTIIRRESGATELEHLSGIYTNLQLVVNLLVMTFLTPCINAIIVLFKERGFKTSILIISSVFVYAVLIGAAVNHTCRVLGITFT
jgi:ferrous iron transport protein B